MLAWQESKGLDADVLIRALQTVLLPLPLGEGRGEGSPNLRPIIQTLIAIFAHAKAFGSLIQISPQRNADVRELLLIMKQALGRYSLDAPGLIYAHAGNVGFDAGRYGTFPADADGIIPLIDEQGFDDDAASRVPEFLLVFWGDGSGVVTDADARSPSPKPSPQRCEGVTAAGGGLDVNMACLAESLGAKASETPDETIRRYLADKFYKDHLQTYKKRPIYWLFSSAKHSAFQALAYLHRYHEGTLARLRAEYVVPLAGKNPVPHRHAAKRLHSPPPAPRWG